MFFYLLILLFKFDFWLIIPIVFIIVRRIKEKGFVLTRVPPPLWQGDALPRQRVAAGPPATAPRGRLATAADQCGGPQPGPLGAAPRRALRFHLPWTPSPSPYPLCLISSTPTSVRVIIRHCV